MLVDAALVGAALAGALAGWRRGFVMPLIAVSGIVLGLSALYAGPGSSLVPAGAAGIGVAHGPRHGASLTCTAARS